MTNQNSKCNCPHDNLTRFSGSQCNDCYVGLHTQCINNNINHPTTSKSEEITFMCPSCDMRYVYKNGSTECPNCEPTSSTRLENWEEKQVSAQDKVQVEEWETKLGQLTARAWQKGLWHSESELSKSLKSFISTLLQEERGNTDSKWFLALVHLDSKTRESILKVKKDLDNLQQSNEK